MKDKKEMRRLMFDEMEQRLREWCPKEEDRLFYYHSSENRIVLSHAMFWVLSGTLRGKIEGCWQTPDGVLRIYTKGLKDAVDNDKDGIIEFLRTN